MTGTDMSYMWVPIPRERPITSIDRPDPAFHAHEAAAAGRAGDLPRAMRWPVPDCPFRRPCLTGGDVMRYPGSGRARPVAAAFLVTSLMAALGAGATVPAVAAGAAVHSGGSAAPGLAGWTGTWAASPQQARPADLTGAGDPTVTGFDDQTVREIVHTSIGGAALRIHLSNAFSQQVLTVGALTVGAEGTGADLAQWR